MKSDFKMQKSEPQDEKFSFQFNWKLTLVVAFFLCLMMSLGFWQLDREQEKLGILETLRQRSLAAPVAIDALVNKSADDVNFQKVIVNGRYQNSHSILIDNQIVDGQFGYELVTAFETNDRIVLVSRGWLPGSLDRRQLPAIEEVMGKQELKAEVYVPAGEPFVLGKEQDVLSWPLRVVSLDIDALQASFNKPIYPYVVRLVEGNPGVYRRHWKAINIEPEKHRGYAIQWFTMSFTLVVLYFIASSNIASIIRSK